MNRKFLNGISPELRKNISVFCNNPYADDVNREGLLEHCRKARTHLSVPTTHDSVGEYATDKVLLGSDAGQPSGQGEMLAAINDISLQMQEQNMLRIRRRNFLSLEM